MAKIINDKYYTSDALSKYCVEKTKEIIGEDNITEYLEPSAGNGSFLNHLPSNTLAYDLYPEDDRIIKQDYLTLELGYKKGRCIIGNPPYGRTGKSSVQFFNKSVELGDYLAFILPISQYENNYDFYKFDFIHSEDLGVKYYSGKGIHCCLNIFKRNDDGLLNKRKIYDLKDVEIQYYQRGRTNSIAKSSYNNFKYDIRLCAYGEGSLGKQVDYECQFVKELAIKINNVELKNKVISCIKTTDWKKVCINGHIGLSKWRLCKYLKEQIPELI